MLFFAVLLYSNSTFAQWQWTSRDPMDYRSGTYPSSWKKDDVYDTAPRSVADLKGYLGLGTSEPRAKLHIKGWDDKGDNSSQDLRDPVLFLEPAPRWESGRFATIKFGNNDHSITGKHGEGMTFYDTEGFKFLGRNPVLFLQPNPWDNVSFAQIKFGDENHFIRVDKGKGMLFTDVDGFKFTGGHIIADKSLKFTTDTGVPVNDAKIGINNSTTSLGLIGPGLNIIGTNKGSIGGSIRTISLFGQISQLDNTGINQFIGSNNFPGAVCIGSGTQFSPNVNQKTPYSTLDVGPKKADMLWATATFRGTTHYSHFNFGSGESTWIRGGKINSHVYINNSTDGNLYISDNSKGGVGIGTTAIGTYKLAVEGKIGARQVDVKVGAWSDFVFEKDYKIKSLQEVENYIDIHKHLPDVPSEATVLKEGIDLGKMDALLLQKIEELTLYLIEQNKQMTAQNKQIENQQKQIEQLSMGKEKCQIDEKTQ